MDNRVLAILGASGDVGGGIVRSAVERGWSVTAVGRSAERLQPLVDEHGTQVRLVVGDVGTDASAAELARALGPLDAAVVTVSPRYETREVLEWPVEEFNAFVAGNVGAHLAAARHVMPLVRDGGDFLGIGGGMADVVIPRFIPLATAQAAQRQLYRGLIREGRGAARVRIRELLVASFVAGVSNRAQMRPEWITDDEIGEHVLGLLEQPAGQDDPDEAISVLRSPREHLLQR
ncbi:SDR family NAD(P)-dependent oxidoreductase [Aeromicrobium choanae]|uniref:Enoyl-(Acyl carrier protein) reductase n=1 Tax=Aeromicrobium choanae TaxID=1736691 RepID=A0A1T4YWH7_9ACTN|nr:SDR family NAD(P)-dependent oxidoreductase [Aeromicrobium choanae]SKB06197.1 Enoyl-(Acyl carrier protein) reductase [Aeromicrobium choanae]